MKAARDERKRKAVIKYAWMNCDDGSKSEFMVQLKSSKFSSTSESTTADTDKFLHVSLNS